MQNKITFLGTGNSLGIPVIGCKCRVCRSKDTKDKRLRPSILVKIKGKKFLIDAGPDFRYQALQHHIDQIDGVFLTHLHYDHASGIDDLRILAYQKKKPIKLILSKESFEEFQHRFDYLFSAIIDIPILCSVFSFHVLEDENNTDHFENMDFSHFSYVQLDKKVTGFRFFDTAYVVDIREYNESLFSSLKGVHTLIISALRLQPSDAHFGLEEAIEFSKKVGAKKTYFTHISHDI
jgi:phosphoribosyl 1,2-cyclic phosphate phosphodiesterase